ncbi:alpha,alpha-trehalase [Candidatus Curtissbacteria bacterium]|nr:alpha,alpha-trehalase [Candidatus Curtissbacteria bacterium]
MSSNGKPHWEIEEKDIYEVLKYIDSYWPKLTKYYPEDLKSLIGLPNSYVVPAAAEIFQEQYYWDSYPVVRALIDHPKYSKLAVGMVDNLLHMMKRFGIIPNASRMYFLSRSQPPLLSSMVWIVYQKTKDEKWFGRAIKLVEEEYWNVWMGKVHLRNFRFVHMGLSRYYDLNALHILAEAESGWDNTNRFMGRCMDFLPVDLNSLLYLYEVDLAKAYEGLGNSSKKNRFEEAAKKRAKVMNELMWDEKVGYFFDYDFVLQRRSHLITVAGMYPLNVGIATQQQADRVVEVFQHELHRKWGVVQSVRFVENLQWDWPNGWAPLQIRSAEALMRYGYNKLAKKIITKWMALNIKIFKETGELWEKYDVVHGRIGVPDKYPTPSGFAWTNAGFMILSQILEFLENKASEKATPVWLVRHLGWH